jgi:hypothetical protein
VTAAGLLELVELELGHAAILDNFQARAGQLCKAVAPRTILHIISGNTPAAGLQSLTRGLLLGSYNRCKIPSAGLPELEEFRQALPTELQSLVEISPTLPDEWLTSADAVIVFGSDETIAHFRSMVRPHQIFVAHGHRVSFAVVLEDPEFRSVAGAARDISIFDQQGCLSPQVLFARDQPRAYAARLAEEMERYQAQEPRAQLTPAEAAAIRGLREEIAFRAANGEPVALWQSLRSTDWTVIFEETELLSRSPLNRVIHVLPLPADLRRTLAHVQPHLSTAGIWPPTAAYAHELAPLGLSRICPLGRMQEPPLSWHQDGQPVLASLVRWLDLELA